MIEKKLFVGDRAIIKLSKEELIDEIKALYEAFDSVQQQNNQLQMILRQIQLKQSVDKLEVKKDGKADNNTPTGPNVSPTDKGNSKRA